MTHEAVLYFENVLLNATTKMIILIMIDYIILITMDLQPEPNTFLSSLLIHIIFVNDTLSWHETFAKPNNKLVQMATH